MSPSRYLLGCFALFVYAGGLLSIGITKDWRLIHEDNGAFYSTLALSHLHLGLKETRAHDFFYDPHTKQKTAYGHHPPALALALAAAFAVTGSDAPWAARLVPVTFHLMSLALLLILLRALLNPFLALLGGFFMATLPQSAFFGRMVGYEPLGLFTAMLQLTCYALYRVKGEKRYFCGVILGVVLAGLVDWAPLYFGIAICLVEFADWCRGRQNPRLWISVALAGISIFLFDLWHMAYSNHASLGPLAQVLSANAMLGKTKFSLVKFVLIQVEKFRRYFTHAGLLSCVWVALFAGSLSPVLRRVLGIAFLAAAAYLCSVPKYAQGHLYTQFYFIPAVAISMVLVWQKLRGRRFLVLVFWLDIAVSTAYSLHVRHSRVGAYAVRTRDQLRRHYLPPAHLNSVEGAGGKGVPAPAPHSTGPKGRHFLIQG